MDLRWWIYHCLLSYYDQRPCEQKIKEWFAPGWEVQGPITSDTSLVIHLVEELHPLWEH